MDWYVPLLAGIALFGLDMLLDTLLGRTHRIPKGHRVPSCIKNSFESEEDSFVCCTSFGQENHLCTIPLLSRGQAEVNFGNLALTLTECEAFAKNCQLELHSNVGELSVLLPRSCQAEINIQTAFAVCDTFGAPDPDADSQIYVNGNASFGHIAIRYI